MNRRDFIRNSALTAAGIFTGLPTLEANSENITFPIYFDLEKLLKLSADERPHFAADYIDKCTKMENPPIFHAQWPQQNENGKDVELLVDNLECFIAYKGEKVISWDKPEEKENRKTHHPLIYGQAKINGKAREDLTVPLTRSAVIRHPLWHENISAETLWENILPRPKEITQRYHDIAPAPEAKDPRHISHFLCQKENEKLAYNILNWQPDQAPEDAPYPKSNNRFLLHLMAIESARFDTIGPNANQLSVRYFQRRNRDQNEIGTVSVIHGSYGGLSQMGINRENGDITGSIVGTPFVKKLGPDKGAWANYTVNGEAIKSKEDFLGNWQAQMLATVYTQLKSYDYLDLIKRRMPEPEAEKVSSAGAFAAMHLRGPGAASNFIRLGIDRTDGNGTPVSAYYNWFAEYPEESLYKLPKEMREAIFKEAALAITEQGQKEQNEAYAINRWRNYVENDPANQPVISLPPKQDTIRR